jgi:hypothetical protein
MMKQLAVFFVFFMACPSKNPTIENASPDLPETHVATHGKCAASCDLSTDEKLGALYFELTGRSLEPTPRCVSRSAVLPRAITVGTFASDHGCLLRGVFIDCCYSELREPAALVDLAWTSLETKQRETLAVQFSQEVVLAFDRPLNSATEDFGLTLHDETTPAFTSPSATSNADGTVAVEYWSNTTINRLKPAAPSYEKWRLTFGAKGFLIGNAKIATFQGKPFEPKKTPPIPSKPK